MSIFRAIFVPLFALMILQAVIFYLAAVYGGIEESLTQNAADILSERLENRKYEVETLFNSKWTKLDDCGRTLGELYRQYEAAHGSRPLANDPKLQIAFLSDSADTLIGTLRHNEVNGVFLILNDQEQRQVSPAQGGEQKYGLCIRDMDPDSNFTGTEDLQLERSPSSLVDSLGCQLDSWWESKYAFASAEDGDYYYRPLSAAWDNPGAEADDLAYCSGAHSISVSDPSVVSYSVPLVDGDGYPYGILGIEMTTRRLASLLPARELNDADKSCYVLALRLAGTTDCQPIVATGSMYSRCFSAEEAISCADTNSVGGFQVTGGSGVQIFGKAAQLDIYNNNNPFESRELVLLALVESQTLFEYVGRVKVTLMVVAVLSLALGLLGIGLVSRRFAAPITKLAGRVRSMSAQKDFQPGHLGVAEIDQLVDSIVELNRNVNRNSARTEFFSRMSHDMRTPMNAIISFSSPELLAGATETAKDDYLQKIHASGELLLTLINEVLDMTKIESSKTELRREPLRAELLCEAVIPIISELASQKSVRFDWEVAVSKDSCVLVDKQHLNQIVMNLLSNAIKFTPEGGSVRLTVNEAASDDPGVMQCRISVADTGVGMSEAFQKKLYTPFEQENGGQGGTGLGLSIAKKLAELMGGDVQCESRLNVGTTFTVALPLQRCAWTAAATPAVARVSAESMEALRGKQILICEDNAINIIIIEKVLHTKGIVTRTVTDGRAGVEAFSASEPYAFDAILMDIRMPLMDGLAATRKIRALPRPDAATVPIIAMTADAFEEDERASEKAGMNAHLAKPLENAKLFETLVRLLAECEA